MIERRIERAKDGGIETIYERTLTPLEEAVAIAWPHVKRRLRQQHIADLPEVEITIGNVPPGIDPRAVADGICDKIISDAEFFVGAKWRRLIFTYPGASRS